MVGMYREISNTKGALKKSGFSERQREGKEGAAYGLMPFFFCRIWLARNDKIFKGKATTTRSIVRGIKQDVFLWLSTRINVSRDVWRNWCRFPLGE
ncbi:hypothetical protein Hdeb2414_s0016g00480571 [Helianthus debilis subsp. tardiflorus]